MKLIGWIISAGAMMIAATAGAQTLPGSSAASGYMAVSDFGGPYAAMPPDAMPPRYLGPEWLPPRAIYGLLRDLGYAPLGGLRQRGPVYTIAVISPDGDDGRLLIDARSGRILRFMPAFRIGRAGADDAMMSDEPRSPLPPLRAFGPPLPVSRLASRSNALPLPKPTPPRAVVDPHVTQPKATPPLAAQPAPAAPQQSAAAGPAAAATPSTPAVAAKPPLVLQPTQEMPPVQGLE